MATPIPGPTLPPTGALPALRARPGPSPVHRRVWVILVVVAVVIASLFGAVVLLGGSGSTPPPTFAEARSVANGSVASVGGGGWTLLSGLGLDERSGSTVSLGLVSNTTGSGCSPVAVGGTKLPTSLAIPAYSGSLGAGRAPFWLFLFRQTAAGPFLLATVTGGAAGPLAELTGSGCAANLTGIGTIPAHLVDSPVVAGRAWTGTVDASAFVATDTAIDTLVMVATGSTSLHGLSFSGWGFEYAPCGPFASGTLVKETTLVAGFTPTGGLLASGTSTTNCTAPAP
ncbi:MAG: hypothetical protein ACLQD8_03935 [Thermoplasmata archaeon]